MTGSKGNITFILWTQNEFADTKHQLCGSTSAYTCLKTVQVDAKFYPFMIILEETEGITDG